MKTLPTFIKKRGFAYEQIVRKGNVAVYSQIQEGRIVAFETIIIRVGAASERHGIKFPAMELYPGDTQFGLFGWSHGVFEDENRAKQNALDHLEMILQTRKV